MNAVTWAARAYLGVQAAFWAVIGAIAVRDWWRRAGREIDQAVENVNRRIAASITDAGDDALALICDPCNGKPGICKCTSKASCPHPLCGAADTGTDRAAFDRELAEWLEGDGRG